MLAELALAVLQTVTALPTSKLAWDFPVADPVERFELQVDTAPFISVAIPSEQTVTGASKTYAMVLPALTAGSHTTSVRACVGAVCSSPSTPVAFTMDVPPPVCADIPSVFITRWSMTSGRPGSRMRLDYQLASASPIVQLQAKVAGNVVATVSGTDLRDSGGIWFTTPAVGVYKLQLSAKNSAGCSKDVFSLIDLQVK